MLLILNRVADVKFGLSSYSECLILSIMSQHGRDVEKQGFSYMDGVPVKISEKYKPPKKHNLPVGFMHKFPTETIAEEYDFQLEKSVLEKIGEWRKIRQDAVESRRKRIEAEDLAIREQAEKLKELSTGSSAQTGAAFEESINSSSNAESPNTTSKDITNQSAACSSKIIEKEEKIEDNSQNVAVTMYGQMFPTQSNHYAALNILTPTPYGLFMNKKQDSVATAFNLSDFEADTSSPFDNMELKTINDMEELAHVLQPMSNSHKTKVMPSSSNLPPLSYYPSNPAANAGNQPRNAQVPNPFTTVPVVGGELLGKSLPQMNGVSSYSLYGTVPRNQIQPVNHVKNTDMHSSPFSAYEDMGYYPMNSMNSGMVLRGGPQGYYSENPWDYKKSVDSMTSKTRVNPEFVANKGNVSQHGMTTASSVERPIKNMDNNNSYAFPVSHYFSPPMHSDIEKVVGMTNSDTKNLRGSKSVPDIMKELETELRKQPVNQVSLRHNCNTPPIGETRKEKNELENWRPWPNLDSPESPELPSRYPESSSSKVTAKTDRKSAENKSSLQNPFAELPSTGQRLVRHISEMGFSIPRVSRACQIFGEDDKKIVEYLLQVQSLEEKNYPSDLVEKSLIANNFDEVESINYMKLVSQLMDLGFSENRVIEALKMHENDGEKALDYLVS
ncbi:hypothetical protein J437_LFUL004616 [Ladona fulva]|uniref:Ubiquitin-associated protein 1 n=1 Tax=Ladona fulva TaxID=123851 RepID=A0A8K0K032_LADFU|nr:hypothetical protein J437_LFUL004616 [Ladona fulva]